MTILILGRSVSANMWRQGPIAYCKNLSKAKAIYDRSLPPLPPSLIPDSSYVSKKPPNDLPPSYMTCWHGTALARVDEQIREGKFEHRKNPVYITDKDTAFLYCLTRGGGEKDGVVLKLLCNEKRLTMNSFFNTLMVDPGPGDSEVYITDVYKVNPKIFEEWKKRELLSRWTEIDQIAKGMSCFTDSVR